ncbi:hypothetical protein FO519_010692, partial [Halicephalobus sp. NKZ332]
MSNKGGKTTTNKLMNFARRLPSQGPPKRPLQGSPAGPPSKKVNSSLSGPSMGRKPEEGIKDKKPLFELTSDWRDLAGSESITGSDFDAKKEEFVKKSEVNPDPSGSESGTSEADGKGDVAKNNGIEKFILISLRSLADSSR